MVLCLTVIAQVVFCGLASGKAVVSGVQKSKIDLLMPSVQPKAPDTYLCHSMAMDKSATFITEFIPHANMETAHHILLYGCKSPGAKDPVWNCGKMAPTCASGSKIIYAWAMDAKSLDLPKDVAFKVGGDSGVKYLVLQVHYKNVNKFLPPESEKDNSGITMVTTKTPKSQVAQ